MIEIAKLKKMLDAEIAANAIEATFTNVEQRLYDLATGVKESCVYQGPEGSIHKQEMLSGTQYQARRGNKGHYHASQRGAMSWLKKQHAKSNPTKVESAVGPNKFHGVLEKHGFKAHNPVQKQSLGQEHLYTHPNREGMVNVSTHNRSGNQSWSHYFKQKNGLIAPSSGETKGQLDKNLTRHYGDKNAS